MTTIEAVLAHPPFAERFYVSEHYYGELPSLGDDLGVDCVIHDFIESDELNILRPYRTNGRQNEDWIGWQKNVLSPCAGTVIEVTVNPVVNRPGTPGNSPASSVTIRASDGTHFSVVHLDRIQVREGEHVERGSVLGVVGNNGYSRHPHIHLGAWRDGVPLQIRFDQVALGQLLAARSESNNSKVPSKQ